MHPQDVAEVLKAIDDANPRNMMDAYEQSRLDQS